MSVGVNVAVVSLSVILLLASRFTPMVVSRSMLMMLVCITDFPASKVRVLVIVSYTEI